MQFVFVRRESSNTALTGVGESDVGGERRGVAGDDGGGARARSARVVRSLGDGD